MGKRLKNKAFCQKLPLIVVRDVLSYKTVALPLSYIGGTDFNRLFLRALQRIA
jgi:hypothetical protein